MPPAWVRLAIEAALVVLVAVGAALSQLDRVAIVALTAAAAALALLVERAYGREAARANDAGAVTAEPAVRDEPSEARHSDIEPPSEGPEEPEPELAVNERSARAILATSQPPMSEPSRATRSRPRREPAPAQPAEPERQPEPAPETTDASAPREWSLWELERIAREHAGDDRQEEWAALILSLREFASADGTLPADFDGLVRESFGELLASAAATEAAAAP